MSQSSSIWLIGGGLMQVPAAKYILSIGKDLLLSDQNPNCPCAAFAKEVIELNTFDILGHVQKAKFLAHNFRIEGVVTVGADCHETVAEVAKELALPGIDPKISKVCRQKDKTREVLSKSNIPQPRFIATGDFKEARDFIKHLETDAVIKATDNSGSRGFSFLRRTEQLQIEQFERALKEGTTHKVIIEEALLSDESIISEQSVETLWHRGKMYFLNWVDRIFSDDVSKIELSLEDLFEDVKQGIELGHVNPALHPAEVKRSTLKMIEDAGRAIGMDKQKGAHILKADIMQTKTGPRILELTPRLSGGWDSGATTPARGANFIGGVVELSTGRELDLELFNNYFKFSFPEFYSAIVAKVPEGAMDCIARSFSLGEGLSRVKALENAVEKLNKGVYVNPLL